MALYQQIFIKCCTDKDLINVSQNKIDGIILFEDVLLNPTLNFILKKKIYAQH